jgi:hypothetical protein
MWNFFVSHSGEIMILVLFTMVVVTLFVLVPQLLRAHLKKQEMQHAEHMRALENGLPVPPEDERYRVAGRTAMLVPMVVIISASTVTCFLVAYLKEEMFAVCLSVWVVSGVVCLAAITGGVALIGRLAQLQSGEEEEMSANPLTKYPNEKY